MTGYIVDEENGIITFPVQPIKQIYGRMCATCANRCCGSCKFMRPLNAAICERCVGFLNWTPLRRRGS